MREEIKSIDPIGSAKLLAVISIAISLVYVPLDMLMGSDVPLAIGIWLSVLLPPIYGLSTFVFIASTAGLYNFLAVRLGGIVVLIDEKV